MSIFTIDSEDNITRSASAQEATELKAGTESFRSQPELTALAAQWPASRLIAIWNSLPGVEPVKRFTDRKTAVARIWKAIQGLGDGRPAATSGSQSRLPAHQATSRRRAHTGHKASKTARVIALLRQPAGASLKAIMRATGWQPHSVRGFISGQLAKKMGLRVKSFQRDGERVYAIRG
jgi:Protein of unknown function (DUF3489)